MWRVEVGDGVGLVTNQVVEAIRAVSVDEAVADPAACAYTDDMLATVKSSRRCGAYLSLMSQTTSKAASAPSSSISPFWTASR